MYDLAIIGGGPAGAAAGVYAARKMLKTVFIAESFGGQSIESTGIENWIGTLNISGPDLAKALEAHIRKYADVLDIKTERADKVSKIEGGLPTGQAGFEVTTAKGSYQAKTVLVATGSTRRKLEVPGAAEFENKGITYCASCDGPLFAGQDVAVIGGGNAGFETAAQLLAYAKSVTLLQHGAAYKADEVTVKSVLAHPNMRGILNADLKEVKGDKFVKSIVYTEGNGAETELPVAGVFVEIGLLPSTALVGGLVTLNQHKQIVIDPKTQRASTLGLWAAGDCTDALFHQNNIAAGDAVKALEDIYLFIKTGK